MTIQQVYWKQRQATGFWTGGASSLQPGLLHPESQQLTTSRRFINQSRTTQFFAMPVPPSLATPDGFFAKTNKAAILHYLLEHATPEDLSYHKDALFIQDGMALLHVLTNLPPTCGDICLQILDQMVAKKHFIFSTDSYHSCPIKAQERLRRGSSDRIILSGPATRKPFDFKIFLANDDNKKQLCQLLLRVWGDRVAASRLQRTEMAILIVEEKAYQLIVSNGELSRQLSFII